jgi:hypothetical protein
LYSFAAMNLFHLFQKIKIKMHNSVVYPRISKN